VQFVKNVAILILVTALTAKIAVESSFLCLNASNAAKKYGQETISVENAASAEISHWKRMRKNEKK